MKNKLTYFIARSSMFGIGFFLIFQNAGKDAWISILLGTLLGIIILYSIYRSETPSRYINLIWGTFAQKLCQNVPQIS